MSKDKHALIKANIALNKQVQELERQNKRYREEIKKILIEMEHDMKLYSDRYGENYNFERYDEVRDYYHLLEDVLEG